MSTLNDLYKALDDEAAALLAAAKGGGLDRTNDAASLPPATLLERVSIFKTVAAYAADRARAAPPAKRPNEEKKFGRLKRDFHGAAPSRRTRPSGPAGADLGESAGEA